jgi:two-component system phosphate regulon sensor histidine kinase PhoR
MPENPEKKNKPLFGFYVLVIYVVFQFSWWSYLMLSLNKEIYELRTELNFVKYTSPAEIISKGNELEQKLKGRRAMIIGEGTVFFTLLVFGIVITRNSFRKENILNQQQKNFILSITHELRSPLASARLQMETLLLRELNQAKREEILRGAMGDIDRLNILVENILLTARIEESTFQLHKERTNLSEFVTGLIDSEKMSTRDHRLVTLEIQPGVFADIDRFSFPSIVLNLYENAVKYSASGSSVLIRLSEKNKQIQFQVLDEGIGIREEDKKMIFKKFFRVGNEETRTTKGTGLGLYIVRYLSYLHGGEISVRANMPRGSIFELVLNKQI